jgi:hypothetical protein
MARNRWTNEEARKVVLKAAELRLTEIGIAKHDALYRAQGIVIEPARRKERIGTYFLNVLTKRLEQLEKNTPAQQLAPAAYVEPAAAAPEPPKEPTLTEMLKLCANLFAASFAEALAPLLAKEIHTVKTNGNGNNGHDRVLIDPSVPIAANGNLPEKLHKHRIAVVGLNGDQRQELMRRFPLLDFRWLDNGARGTTMRKTIEHCEATFLMTKFVNHHAQEAVPRDRRVMVNGGVSDLTRLISARYPATPQAQPHH